MNLENIPKYVINLPHRTDRLESVNKELSKVFNNFEYTLIPGVYDEVPRKGCAQAHINLIKDAKEKNYSNILVMEDDLVFRDNCKDYMIECFNNCPKDYDILLSGIYSCGQKTKYNEYWNKIDFFSSTHFMVINEKLYDTIISFDKSTHIDQFLASKELNLDVYVTNKFFALQAIGFSDNAKRNVNYTSYINESELL